MTGTLRRQLTLGMATYTLLLSIAVAAHGVFVNESAEALIWKSLLQTEFAHFHEREKADPGYRWVDSDLLRLYGKGSAKEVPAAFALPPGVHDEIAVGGRLFVVMVEGEAADRSVMAVDITEMERSEQRLIWTILASSAGLVCLLVLAINFGVRRLIRPLTTLAREIAGLLPDHSGQRVEVERRAPHEAQVIANGINSYLARNDEFVERERKFIRMASHELRTPIAVLISTAEVAIDQQGSQAPAPATLRRVLDTAHEMQDMVALLLVLARDPARLRSMMDPVELMELVSAVVQDHRPLAQAKKLDIEIIAASRDSIQGPRQIVAAMVANLVRNAIENSEHGVIRVTVTATQVIVEDPGHSVSGDERSRIYTQMARDGSSGTGGIGLELIARACAHLGWRLDIEGPRADGTRATLDFRSDA